MGYLEDLKSSRLQEFLTQLNASDDSEKANLLLSENYSIVSFSYGLRDGRKVLRAINEMIKELEGSMRQLAVTINKFCAKLKTELKANKDVSPKARKVFLKEVKKELLAKINASNEALKKLKRIKYDILLRIGNIFLYIFSALLSFGFGALLYLNNIVVNAIVYPISIIAILGFVAIQVLYTIKYLRAIKATIRGIIDFSIKRAFSTLLMVWWYIFMLAIANKWSTNIVTYSFMAVFALNVVFLIFDMFLSSQLFDEEESIFSLIAAITIGIFYFTDSINNTIVKQIGTSILLIACFLLHILIIKKFILDKRPIKDILGIMNVVGIIATTIILTIVASYKLLWQAPVDGQVVDNTLFSAVVGLYAAILGGGLTLAGVAWTIKHGEQQRKEEECKKLQPLFNFVNRNLFQKIDHTKLTYIYGSKLIDSNNNHLEKLQAEIFIETFSMENTSKTEFFVCGLYLNNVLYKTSTKELIKKEHTIIFDFEQVPFNLETINEIKLYIEDLMGIQYIMQLEFTMSDNSVTITGNKPLQLVEKTNE